MEPLAVPSDGKRAVRSASFTGHIPSGGFQPDRMCSSANGEKCMKVNVEVTCTPEEARAFFGLPDLGPMQQRVMGEIEDRLRSSLGAMSPEAIFKTWIPASMQGV